MPIRPVLLAALLLISATGPAQSPQAGMQAWQQQYKSAAAATPGSCAPDTGSVNFYPVAGNAFFNVKLKRHATPNGASPQGFAPYATAVFWQDKGVIDLMPVFWHTHRKGMLYQWNGPPAQGFDSSWLYLFYTGRQHDSLKEHSALRIAFVKKSKFTKGFGGVDFHQSILAPKGCPLISEQMKTSGIVHWPWVMRNGQMP